MAHDPTSSIPPIPVHLSKRPRVAGRVVPWITAVRPHDLRPFFGSVNPALQELALRERLCQICGQRLGEKVVFLVRESDLARLIAPEPAMHAECSWYAKIACPHLNGERGRHRASPPPVADPTCTDPACGCGFVTQDPGTTHRLGAQAENWLEVWMPRDYRILPAGGNRPLPMAMLLPTQVLRVRPIARGDQVTGTSA